MLFKKKRKYKKKTSKQKEQKELDEIWAKKVKDRDNWTCQICNKKFDKVNAHQCTSYITKTIKRIKMGC